MTISHLDDQCLCEGKCCNRCQTLQCLGNFHRWSRSKDGYRSICKACRKTESETEEFKANRRAHHQQNAEHIDEKKREWYHSNPERPQGYVRQYREENPEKVKITQQEANRSERGKQRYRDYRTRHPEKVKQFTQAWKDNHPEMAQEHAKVRAANYKAGRVGVSGKITTQQWREVKTRYQNTCLRCGQKEPTITLTIDHVIPFALRGSNEISNVQPLCEFCNTSKGIKVVDYRSGYEEKDCG